MQQSDLIPSLYNTTALLYPRYHHPRQLFAAEGKRVYTDFGRTLFKDTTFHTDPPIPIPFAAHKPLATSPTAPAMTIARTAAAMHPRLRSSVCRRVYANGYRTYLLRLLCANMYICICVRAAAVELGSNCAKLRISVGDELRDLQYNYTTPSVVPPRPKELQPRSKLYMRMRRVCTGTGSMHALFIYVFMCAIVRKQTRSQRLRNVGIPIPVRYLRKRIAR